MVKEIKQEPIKYEDYYVIRAIKQEGNKKTVIAEKECRMKPEDPDIVKVLQETKCSFVSIEHNYRLYNKTDFEFAF